VRERDEERVEGLGSVRYNPTLKPVIEANHVRRRRGSAAPLTNYKPKHQTFRNPSNASAQREP
jgi:hypothetical protein